MRRLVILLVLLSSTLPAIAQKAPGHELGFKPDRIYSFGGIDTVNLMNGNLSLNIPLGLQYRLSSRFAYQLHLVYNAKVWDYETWTEDGTDYAVARPNLRSNAGVGWRVTLGQLLEPHNPTVELYQSELRHGYVYESPSGAEYPFSPPLEGETPQPEFDPETTVQFNTTGKLRLIVLDAATKKVEFPSGEVHTFTKDGSGKWRLSRQADGFGNWLQVTYTLDSEGRDASWVITDSAGRSHTVTFANKTALSDTTMQGQVVTNVSFAGQSQPYVFDYVDRDVEYGCGHNRSASTPPTAPDTETTTWLPLLETVTLPDQTAFEFVYHLTGADECSQGAVKRLVFPTGGHYDYIYQKYFMQMSVCGETAWNDMPVGVKSKTTSEGHTWDYVQHPGPAVDVYDPANDTFCGTGEGGNQIMPVPPNRWVRTSVLSPAAPTTDSGGVVRLTRTRTDHYFHWWNASRPDPLIGDEPPPQLIQGVASTLAAPSATSSQTGYANDGPDVLSTDSTDTAIRRFLATRVFEHCANDRSGNCSSSVAPGGRLLRTTFVRNWALPEDGMQLLRSDGVQSSRTEFNDDTGCGGTCSTTVTSSDRNGAGQSRTATSTSNFPYTETTTTYTAYPTWTATALRDTARRWNFETYTEVNRTHGSVSHRTLHCFGADGLLQRVRKLAGSAAGPADILKVFEWTGGNLTFDSTYGGDRLTSADSQNLGTSADVCTAPLPAAPVYKVGHEYANGVPKKSTHYADGQPLTFSFLDRTIDTVTGLATADRDTAGVATTYAYDAATARLTTVDPPGAAVTDISYTSATGTANARADAITKSSSTTLLHEQTTFDGLGRPLRQSRLTPDNVWVTAQSTYDGLGRKASVTVPVATGSAPPTANITGAVTSYEYDAFGRATRVTAPDGSLIRFVRTGDRVVTRYANIGTTVGGQQEVATTEEYDGYGRLIRVTERAGPTSASTPIGANVTTEYRYDASNNLVSVVMRGADGVVQNRVFDYDGRGFLRWESQPESGMTSYLYDAGGNVASKIQGAANSIFDLNYVYDSAARLIRLDGRNPYFGADYPGEPGFRIVKSFEFAAANEPATSTTPENLQRGKLVRATRYNYDDTEGGYYEPVYKVEHHYAYTDAAAGNLRVRSTKISTIADGVETLLKDVSMEVERNELGNLKRVLYPTCFNCGTPPVSPQRDLQYTYDAGRLDTLHGYVSDVTYWPNGLRKVLPHSNGIADTQQSAGMARPTSLSFGVYDRCVQPAFSVQPVSTSADASGSATLSVTVTGTAPFTYAWYKQSDASTVLSTTAELTVTGLTQTKEYYAAVQNECGRAQSRAAKVTVNECAPPSTGTIAVVSQPDGSWILRPDPVGRSGLSFTWTRLADNTQVGTAETLAVTSLTATTTYRLTVADACGTATGEATITVPLPAPTGLVATWAAPALQVNLTWSAVAGAENYHVQRRSGGEWEGIATTTGTSYSDIAVASTRTYAYRVFATATSGSASNYTPSEVATTMAFTKAVAGTDVNSVPFDSMLAAVNAVRTAAGWPSVTWSNILSSADPLPAPGQLVLARHITACRARMNEALQALGAGVSAYTDGVLEAVEIRAQYVNEVQARAD